MPSHDEQPSLFASVPTGPSPHRSDVPLAQRMRPTQLDELVGQEHFLNSRFRKVLESDQWSGLIFWGPPGTGKTSLASVVSRITQRTFHVLSAVTAGVKDIKEVLETSRASVHSGQPAHILFIDEIHRLNKAQQDVLLPFLEEGTIKFIGATTENPSFEINNAIASRSIIFKFDLLAPAAIASLLKRAHERHYPRRAFDAGVIEQISEMAMGDARRALTLLDHLVLTTNFSETISLDHLNQVSQAQNIYYDKKSEAHYDTISAFIKSIRGSDPDAAIYYLARMLEGGEDPVFIARRLVILASEDVGNAAPMGLVMASSTLQAVHAVGMPEARIILAQTTTYLACAEKSNRSYEAIGLVRKTGNLEIPYSIRNAPTKMMKEWGYGADYKYAHSSTTGWVPMQFLPDAIKNEKFYEPSSNGFEKNLKEQLQKRKSPKNPN